jgi:hypothetical protein
MAPWKLLMPDGSMSQRLPRARGGKLAQGAIMQRERDRAIYSVEFISFPLI